MGQVERIEIKRIYLGKAALFGLLYGLIVGLILGLFVLIINLLSMSLLDDFTSSVPGASRSVSAGTGAGLVLGFVIIVAVYSIASCAGSFIFAVFYNLVARMGGSMHLGLVEVDRREEFVR